LGGKPHFSILATSFAGGPRPRNAALILSGLWFFVFFCSLFSPPLLDDADATHAQAARAMVQTGDYVTLKVDGVRYLEKAPLPYWLVASSFRVFGYNTFAAHLPLALAVGLLMLLGHRWANQAFGARTGFYTAIGVLTSVGVFLFTRILIPEVLLSLFLAAALFSFLKSLGPIAVAPPRGAVVAASGEVGEQPAVIWDAGPLFYPYVMWGCVALAVLTKGLVALVFFVGTAVVYLALTDEWRKWRLLRPFTGSLVFLAIAAPWHVLAGLRNHGGDHGHGFWWFYFWNEHVLRFLGRRVPMDYNKMPGWLFWAAHLVWLFPWVLFLPLGVGAIWRRLRHQDQLARHAQHNAPSGFTAALKSFAFPLLVAITAATLLSRKDVFERLLIVAGLSFLIASARSRVKAKLEWSPFHRIDPQQKTILVLGLFAGFVLLFFSLSTNQEYYTFPAYLPILLLIGATITRAEQTYAFDAGARRWVTFAHAALTVIGGCAALALVAALWVSRHSAFVPDVGDLLAHRGVGDYTLSMSHLFDLTTDAFAGLRLPAALAAAAFALGPAAAWMLRVQRRHVGATTAIAFTSAAFLIAAHVALGRFGSLLSSEAFAAKISALESSGEIARDSRVMLYGDQAFGSSIPFYLGEQVGLVEGRSTSMWFGSTFPDAPKVFLSNADLLNGWGVGERKLLFVPAEQRDGVEKVLAGRPLYLLYEASGKELVTDRALGVGR
jgi:4-amino-4-deoxy-L-arabinose transferase-like glycosyltransferase